MTAIFEAETQGSENRMNNSITIRDNDVKRSYLKLTKVSRFYGIGIAVLLAAVALVWLIAISFTVRTSGFCYPSQKSVRFFFPVGIEESLKIGDTVLVGDAKGTISFFDDGYFTSDTLDDSTDAVSVAFMNSKYYNPDETYRSGIAIFSSEIVGTNEYNLMWEDFTIGGKIHEWTKEVFGRKG